MSFLGNAVSVLFTSTAMVPVGLAISILLARYLSVEDRGTFGVAVAMATSIVMLAQLGWAPASIYRLRAVHDPPARVASAALVMVGILSVLAIGICLLLQPQLSGAFLKGAPAWVFPLALALVPFQLASLVFRGIARGIDRFSLQNGAVFAVRLGTLAGLVGVLVLGAGDVVSALKVVVVVEVVAALGLVTLVLLRTGLATRPDPKGMWESLRFGVKSYALGLAGQLHERVDIFMIAALLDDSGQVAFYVVAASTVFQAKLIPESIGMALFPTLAGLDREESGRLAARVSRHTLFWTLLAVLALAAVAPLLLPLLYGSAYQASVAPFRVLLPAMALLGVYRILSRYFVALGRQQVSLGIQLVSTFANVVFNLWLIPRYGIVGAALGSTLSYAIEGVVITLVFRRNSGQRLRDILLLHRSDLVEYRTRWARLRAGRGKG